MSEEATQITFEEEIGVDTVNITIAGALAQLSILSRIPLLLIGESSTAKTAKMRQVAAHNNMDFHILQLASKEAPDISGPQFPQRDGTYVYLRSGRIPVEYEPVESDRMCYARSITRLGLDADSIEEANAAYSARFQAVLEQFPETSDDRILALREDMETAVIHAKQGEKDALRPMLLMVDEVNRASKETLNAAMGIWAEHRLGPRKLGKNVCVVGAINPPSRNYSTSSTFTSDNAMRRRLAQVGVKFDNAVFRSFRKNPKKAIGNIPFPKADWELDTRVTKSFHKAVDTYLDQTPDASYDSMSAQNGKVFGCPATWEYVSWLLHTADAYGLDKTSQVTRRAISAFIAGCVGVTNASDVWRHYATHVDRLTPQDIYTNFDGDEDTDVVSKVMNILDRGEHAVLASALQNFATYVMDLPDPDDLSQAELDSGAVTFDARHAAITYGHIMMLVPASIIQDNVASTWKSLTDGESDVEKRTRTKRRKATIYREINAGEMPELWAQGKATEGYRAGHPGYHEHLRQMSKSTQEQANMQRDNMR